MGIKQELQISDDIWETFKAWKPSVGIDSSTDDWVRLRMEIYRFIKNSFASYRFENPIIEIGSWSLVPGANFSFFTTKYNYYRTNISYGNGNAPIDFLLNAMDMKEIANETVGCIVATDVLEHLADPFRALREFYRVLKNGGHVLITVPLYFELHGEEYFRFTPKGIEKALKDVGFDEVEVICNGQKPINIQVVARKNKQYTLLLLGGGTRCSHIEAFRKKFRVITTDTKKNAPSVVVADKVFFTDEFTSSACHDQILEIVHKENVTAVVPSSHYSIESLMTIREKLDNIGVKVILPDNDFTEICLDKSKTSSFFESSGLNAVPIVEERNTKYPIYFKLKKSAGAKGSFLVHNNTQHADLKARYSDTISQEYMDGDEYTIDVLCDFSGNLLLAVPRLRIETGMGEIIKGKIVHNKKIIDYVRNLTRQNSFIGFCTIQCFEKDGEFYFNEINTRFGGGLTFSIAAGAPFVDYFHMMLSGQSVTYSEAWQDGMMFSRAFRDFHLDDQSISKKKF